ncbi:anthrone oxygenase family protein [Marinomonas sp. TW1]|uniref:anthrone oxygenase family protein n=1 Tax=Marinomonas sp. TW1 TaxID=1561203 RepID=UPI0007AF108D|nr:anthrone oxygenase family protein [Marinomonas sp. TW1]KZN13642.1 hypothetical protein OA79_09765 [Marinomonas sp. TW1]
MAELLIVLLGIMAGTYFAFSAFVMKALNRLAANEAINVMNSINRVILNSVFMPIFFVSNACLLGAFIWHVFHWQAGLSGLWVASALIYLLGMFAVTLFGNVPLNERLKQGAKHSELSHILWHEYAVKWTRLNHVRALSSALACSILTYV